MFTLLAKLLSALNSESSTRQISLAIALGFIVGLSPVFTLHNILFLFVVLFLRVNIASFILAWGFFKGLSYLLSSLIVSVGESLLTAEPLLALFDLLYQFSVFKIAQLHHTYTLGALVLGCVLAIPVYFISNYLVEKYRLHVMAFFEKFRIVKALKASKFYRVYCQVSGQGEMS